MRIRVPITALVAILLAGCDVAGKKTAVVPPVAPKPVVVPASLPVPPPQPLSTPQTSVLLPAEQPLDEASLATEPISAPEPAQVAGPPVRPRSSRTQQPAPAAAPPPAPAAAAPEPPREAVQEIIKPEDKKILLERAQSRRGEANKILNSLGRRSLNTKQQQDAASVRSFLALSEKADKDNDPRQADALAERAWILAKELQSGR